MNSNKIYPAAIALVSLFTQPLASAQGGAPLQEGEYRYSVDAFYASQLDTDFDSDGEFGVERLGFSAEATRGLGNSSSLGLSFSAQIQDYSFDDPAAFSGAEPWEEINRFGIQLSYSFRFSEDSSLLLLPSIEYAGESGADFDDALVFGGVVGYMKQFSETLMLGLGAGIYSGLEETDGFPIIFVNWQFAEEWRLGNPFRPGPVGPAGIEVVYTGFGDWELGAGGSYRSERFALKDSDGFGENENALLFFRASREFDAGSKLDLYLGSSVGGELTLEDNDGRKLASEDYDPAVIIGLAYSFAF